MCNGQISSRRASHRESSSRTKELFNIPHLVLNARHLGGSVFCTFFVGFGVPKKALCDSLGFEIVVEDKLSCYFPYNTYVYLAIMYQ